MDEQNKAWFEEPEPFEQLLAYMPKNKQASYAMQKRLDESFDEWKTWAEELKLHYLVALNSGEHKWFNYCLKQLKLYIQDHSKRWKIQGFINYITAKDF